MSGGGGSLELLKLAIYYASYLYFPAAAALLLMIVRGKARIAAAGLLFALSCLAYARFVEPRILLTIEHEASLKRCFPQAGSARLAIFADTHKGLFANAMPIEQIAAATNKTNADAVMIAGDFVYFLAPERFERTFAALGTIKAPVFAVLGNHDVGLPGPDVSEPLTQALGGLGVIMLDDRITKAEINDAEVEFVGLSELWAQNQKRSLLEARGATPRLVLTHNPSTILELRPREAVDFLVAGHTHGGQINIPGFSCLIFRPMCRVTLYGFSEEERGLVFVTSGTGMVGLPMRFNRAPRIDVVNLSWRACGPS